MSEDIQQDQKHSPRFPLLEEKFTQWTNLKVGAIHESEKILLVNFFQIIVHCLRHYTDNLEKHEEWDDILIKDVVDNLDDVKKKAIMVLSREKDVKDWGEEWIKFFKETTKLFWNDDEGFGKLRSEAGAILLFLQTNNLKEKAKLDKIDASVLKNLLEIFGTFKKLTRQYEDLIRSLKVKMEPIEREIGKSTDMKI